MKRMNAGGERTDTDPHRMSGTVIGRTTMTGTKDMIGTGITMDGTSSTIGIIPPGITNDEKITVDTTTNPVKGNAAKRTLIKNAISRKVVIHENWRKVHQADNRIKAPLLP